MRIGLIADIHGNVLALEAVLADLERRTVDQVINLGDCVSGPLWPRETAELLMRLGWPTIRGNHDRWVTDWPPEKQYSSDAFASRALNSVQLAWLRELPPTSEFDNGIFACHGRPDDDNAYLLENVEAGRLVSAGAAGVIERIGGVGDLRERAVVCSFAAAMLRAATGIADGILCCWSSPMQRTKKDSTCARAFAPQAPDRDRCASRPLANLAARS
jgi:predicted phosphodiesterase